MVRPAAHHVRRRGFRFVEPTALDAYLPPIISMRVAAAIRGRDTGAIAYLPWTEP